MRRHWSDERESWHDRCVNAEFSLPLWIRSMPAPRNDDQTRLISSLSSTGRGKPSLATLIMARPTCSVVVM